jgi:hypothetical protein
MSKYNKKFSLGYPSFSKNPAIFYETLKNSSQQYRDEIFDVYFSDPYKYTFNGRQYAYGDVMGAGLNQENIDYLLKIQNELGIPISITFNETYPNRELTDDKEVLEGFIKHIKKYYDLGVRSCTISHVHLMALGILQYKFPEMMWKNTVNHIITKPQQVVDYHLLGYDVINLDRSLNRHIDIIKEMQPLRKKYPKLILSLLVSESCMPDCPFKVEHDTMNKNVGWDYWDHHGNISCKVWRHQEFNNLPRIGTEMVWGNKATFDEYSELVDYFKFSGRMMKLPDAESNKPQKFIWSNIAHIKGQEYLNGYFEFDKIINDNDIKYAFFDSFTDLMAIVDEKTVISNFKHYRFCDVESPQSWGQLKEIDSLTVWGTKKGQALNKVLMNCRNECWDCHACEKTFGASSFDSLVEVNRDVRYLRGHSDHFNGLQSTEHGE